MAELRYEDEDVQAILTLAVRRQAGPMSRGALLATAAELGFSQAEVDAAEAEYRLQRDEKAAYADFLMSQRRGWNTHLVSFVLVMPVLTALNLLVTKEFPWVLFVGFCWGLPLLFHTVATFLRNTGLHHQAFEDFKKKRTPGQKGAA